LNVASQRLGSIDLAVSHARRLLEKNADLAAEQAGEILNVHPGHPTARLILGAAHRRAGRLQAALDVLDALTAEFPHSAPAHLELGVACFEYGRSAEAEAALHRAVQLNPASPDGWRLLADCLDARGDAAGADAARARYLKAANHDPRLRAAAAALVENNLPVADALLCAHLDAHPTDVAALRMRAEVAGRLRRYADAEELLERCLTLAPSFDAARHNLAVVLNRAAKPAAALPHVVQLLGREPENPGYLNLKAAILANMGDYRGSIETYRGVLGRYPHQPKVWMSLGHALKTEGRQEESVAAYRRAISMEATALPVLVICLGIVLAFAPTSIYPFYTHQPHFWGLSAVEDQNMAGLVMALEQSIVMGIALVYLFYKMLSESESDAQRAERYEVV